MWRTSRRRTRNLAALVAVITVAGCGDLSRIDRGNLQPQTVAGACEVKKFFIVSFQAQSTDMTVSNAGQGCTFTIFNPDLQIVTNAALITSPALHGQATAGLVDEARQASVSYRPQAGYAGPDQFSVTLEPNDRAVRVHVTVQPAAG